MSAPAIAVQKLSKRYHLGAMGHDTLRDHLAHGAKALLGGFRSEKKVNGTETEGFWALKDVSFDVPEGEVLGVVGRNGAGKSTLLKILSQITEPTEGEICVRGRVASLLEVGTGFHPELTGRENVYLNGAVLGMTRREIRARFDEIVAFAEVEKFLDTPVKRYSSGMYVRLAFAVAAHLEPEILVVDEVLAVGDAAFQRKCLGKMSSVAKNGRTVLFVSHNLGAVQRLCTMGLLLERGRLECAGPMEKVLDAYQRSIEAFSGNEAVACVEGMDYSFLNWELRGAEAVDEHACYTRSTCTMAIRLHIKRAVPDALIGFVLWDGAGELIIAAQSQEEDSPLYHLEPGLHELLVTVRLPVKAGLYQIDVSLNSITEGQLERAYLEPKLHILPRLNTSLPEKWHGVLTEKVDFVMNQLSNSQSGPSSP